MTAFYSILHMFVDGVCALAMFGVFIPQENGYFYMLLYNFCAFALQMPIGILLDAWNRHLKTGRQQGAGLRFRAMPLSLPFCTVFFGILCTIIGALTHPMILGIGNALFHVGGGIGVMEEDFGRNWRGKGLGIFVAPGAFGLYLGTLAARDGMWVPCLWGASLAMLLLCLAIMFAQKHGFCLTGFQEAITEENQSAGNPSRAVITAILCCILVVILRSYLGMSVTFPWKTGEGAGFFCVLALVSGKMAGGLLASRFGFGKVAIASLASAAFCYLFSASMPIGLAALFLFNMTMPITLYWMVCLVPQMPGFAFGTLTFALFLGFLPQYFGVMPALEGSFLGCAGSLLSLALIWAIIKLSLE